LRGLQPAGLELCFGESDQGLQIIRRGRRCARQPGDRGFRIVHTEREDPDLQRSPGKLRIVADQGVVGNERRSSRLVVFQLFGDIGELGKGRRFDRETLRCLLQDLFGGFELVVVQQRPAVQRLHVARRSRRRGRAGERLQSLLDGVGTVVTGFGDIEPHPPEGAVQDRLVRCALDGAAERQHRQFKVSGPCVRQTDGHAPLETAVECSEHVQLFDGLRVAIERAQRVGEFLASRD
jgi:hypothetical protein